MESIGLYNTVAMNSGIAGISSVIDGKSPWVPMTGTATGAATGWYVGSKIENKIDTKINPWSKGFDERFDLKYPTMSAPAKRDTFTPSVFGGAVGSEIKNQLVTDPFSAKDKK